MKSLQEMIAVMQAASEGKKIESRIRLNQHGEYSPWRFDSNERWNWHDSDYRVAPEPRKRWVRECADRESHIDVVSARKPESLCPHCTVYPVTEDL